MPSPTVAQEVSNLTTTTLASSVSASLSASAAASILLTTAIVNGAAAPFGTPTDTLGLTWVPLASVTGTIPSRAMKMWAALNPVGGATTVAVPWTGGNANQYGQLLTEVDYVSTVDNYAGQFEASAPIGSNTVQSGYAANANPGLIYAAGWLNIVAAANFAPGTGFATGITLLTQAVGSSGQLSGVICSEWGLLSGVGSQQATFSNNAGQAGPSYCLMVMLDQLAPALDEDAEFTLFVQAA